MAVTVIGGSFRAKLDLWLSGPSLLSLCDCECDWLYYLCVCLQLASGIYSFACSLWSHHTDCFLQQIYARDEAAALGSLERTLLSLKGSNICTDASLHMHMPPLHSHTKWCKWSINKKKLRKSWPWITACVLHNVLSKKNQDSTFSTLFLPKN